MKVLRIALVMLTLVCVNHLRANPTEQEIEQANQGMQMLYDSYKVIDTNCKSITYERLKNELDQLLIKYLDICINGNPAKEEIAAQKNDIKTMLTKIATYLNAHNIKHNSLQQIGNGECAAIIIGFAHTFPFIQQYTNTVSPEEELGMKIQEVVQDLLNFMPMCFVQ